MKKALVFDPYLDTLGGGEFYSLSAGEFLIKKNFSVEIAWSKEDILKKINQRFGFNFKNRVKINPKAFFILNQKGNLLKKYLFTKKYQLIFFFSDGSIPFLFAKKNWLLFQAPFINVGSSCFLNKLKLKKIDEVICYSFFVKKFIDKEFKVDSKVVYPPISQVFFSLKPAREENIILSVGRFDQILNAKKQDVLVGVFKRMIDNGLKDWQLVCLGGLMKENKYFNKLKQEARGYPIKIIANANFQTLLNFYQKAKIYWHAAGFGENLKLHPQKAEHFGISIVEAMAAGAVPLVFNGGGIPEIIGEEKKLLWVQPEGLIEKTKLLIKDSNFRLKLGQRVKKRALFFSKESFFANLSKLLD